MSYTYKYPRPAVTADCVVITKEKKPKVLLIERGNEPFKGSWALPGGFLDMDETLEECVIREDELPPLAFDHADIMRDVVKMIISTVE